MNVTYTWTIHRLICIPEFRGKQNVVQSVQWSCRAEAEINGARYSETANTMSTINEYIEDTPFTPFGDLTQDQVFGWIFSNGLNKQAYEATLASNLEAQARLAETVKMPPWATAGL